MPTARAPFLVTATGVVSDPVSGNPYFAPAPGDSDLFVGISDPPGAMTFSGLTLQIQGSRNASTWYDIGTYTTDDIGPLATPLSPPGAQNTAYKGDISAFAFIQITVLALNGGIQLEVLTGNFFPKRGQPNNSAQVIAELRYLNSLLGGWLGLPQGQLPALNAPMVGTNVGGVFPTGN